MSYSVGILLFEDVDLLDFGGPLEVFSLSKEVARECIFEVFTIAQTVQSIRTFNGLRVIPDYDFDTHPPIDILVLPGGIGTKSQAKNKTSQDWILRNHRLSQATFTVCTGFRLIAGLGLLNNRPATTHWDHLKELEASTHNTKIVSDCRYVDDGDMLTSAGISAGIDLSLYIVQKFYSHEHAEGIRKYMEFYSEPVKIS